MKNKDTVNAYHARKVAGEIDFDAQAAELAMFKPQPRKERKAHERAQWKKQQQRVQARLVKEEMFRKERENKVVTVKAAHTQAIKMDKAAKGRAARAFVSMEKKYGKWFDNQKKKNPSFTEEIDNVNASLEMAGASWAFLVSMIEDNGDETELMKLEIALKSDWDASRIYHHVYTLGNSIAGNMELRRKLMDTLVDREAFKWSDHKQYLTRIVYFMNRVEVKTQYIAERLAEYNVVDKMVRDNRDVEADQRGDALSLSCIAPSYKAINDDVLRTLGMSYA